MRNWLLAALLLFASPALAQGVGVSPITSYGIGLPPPQVGQCLIGIAGPNWAVGSCAGSGTTVSSVTGDGQVIASPTIGSVILTLGNTITNNEIFSTSLNVTGTFEIGGAAILAEATNSALGAVECDGTTINCSSGVISTLGAPATSVTVGTTTVGSGTTGYLLYDNGGTLGNLATTGSGSAVLATSPTLVTPALGAATATTLAVGGASLGGAAVAVTGNGVYSGNLTATNLTLAGYATGLTTPVNPLDAANKAYVDAIAAGQTIYHTPVAVATAAVLPNTPTYNNGSSGVGATLTAGSDVALVVDGVTVSTLTTRVAVIDQASAFQNGIYTLTTAGNGSTEWVLTRATDFNTAEAGNIALGAAFGVTGGNTLANTSYWMNQTAAITVGTTAITFVEFPGCPQFSASIGGCVPATGGVDATHFLNASGGYTVPAGGAGAVTSVGLTVPATSILGVTGSPVTTSGNLGLTTTGTSGGVPYFSSSSALASSGTLTNHALVLGGGSGATPTSLASLGTSTTLLHGAAAGAPTWSQVSLTADVSGNLPLANMASIGTLTALGNVTGGSTTPTALSKTQLTTLINLATASLSGAVPATGGGTLDFLRSDLSWVPGTSGPTLQACTEQTASYALNYAGSTACAAGTDVNGAIPFNPSSASVVLTLNQSTGTVFPTGTGGSVYDEAGAAYPITACLGTGAAWAATQNTAPIAANALCPASGNGITITPGQTVQFITDTSNNWRAILTAGISTATFNVVRPTNTSADATNLQNALNASAAGGLPVGLIPGTYDACGLTVPEHAIMEGADYYNFQTSTVANAITIACGSGTNPILTVQTGYVLLRGFTLKGSGGQASQAIWTGKIDNGSGSPGNTLTISSLKAGTVAIGQYVLGGEVPVGVHITAGSGSSWTVSGSAINIGTTLMSAGTGMDCLDIEAVQSVTVENVNENSCDYGIDATGTSSGVIIRGGLSASNNGYGFFAGNWEDSYIGSRYDAAANTLGGGYLSDASIVQIVGARWEDNSGPGFNLHASGELAFTGNQFDRNGNLQVSGFMANMLIGGGYYEVINTTIAGNSFSNAGYSFGSSTCASASPNIEFGAMNTWAFVLQGNSYDSACTKVTYKFDGGVGGADLVGVINEGAQAGATSVWADAGTLAETLPLMGALNKSFSGTLGGGTTELPACATRLGVIREVVSDGYAWAAAANGVPGSVYAPASGSTSRTVQSNGAASSCWIYQ